METKTWRWIVGAAVSMAILAVLFWLLDDIDQLVNAVKDVQLPKLMTGCLFFLAACACRWWRVWILVPHEQRRPIALLSVSAGHGFMNLLLPMRTGELTFPLLLKRATGQPLGVGATYLFTIRILELAVLILLLSVAISIWLSTPQQNLTSDLNGLSALLIAISLFSVVGILFLPVFVRWMWSLAGRVLTLRALSRIRLLKEVADSLEDGQNNLERLGKTGIAKLCLATTLMWLSLFSMYYMFMQAFSVDIAFVETVVGSSVAIFANLLPINGLGSFGTFELGWVAGFAAIGETSLSSVAAAGLTMHILLVIITGALALFSFVLFQKQPSSL